jgi:hypothetical protein
MVETFHLPARQRRFNAVLRSLARFGVPPGSFSLSTVRGRKTGKNFTVPVAVLAPFIIWLKNAQRASL